MYVCAGVNHNIPVLRDIITQPCFISGDITTNFIAEVYPGGFKGLVTYMVYVHIHEHTHVHVMYMYMYVYACVHAWRDFGYPEIRIVFCFCTVRVCGKQVLQHTFQVHTCK